MLELAIVGIVITILLLCVGYRALLELTGNSHKGCWTKPGCRGNKNCIFHKLRQSLKNPLDMDPE